MRWDRLFDDLEARFEAAEDAAAAAELADLTRAEMAGVTLLARLEAQVGGALGWWIGPGTAGPGSGSAEGGRLDAVLLELGADWVLLGRPRRELLVPLRAVSGITGLARTAVAERPDRPGRVSVARRLSLGTVLRRLARDRVGVSLRLSGGQPDVTGTIDRVAADHLDLAEHPAGESRRPATVLQVRTVPWHAVVWVATGP